jgi:hypothetical protein
VPGEILEKAGLFFGKVIPMFAFDVEHTLNRIVFDERDAKRRQVGIGERGNVIGRIAVVGHKHRIADSGDFPIFD